MSSPKKIIAVLGATGVQGGGVARDLLKDGEFAVRAITRKAESPAALALKELGAEIAVADTSDEAALTKAFEGAYGVFAITDFWALFYKNNFDQKGTEQEEIQHGKNVTNAAKAAGVKHFVWSTLERMKGNYCYHWESKAAVDDYIIASGIPYTCLQTSFYYQNFYNFKMLREESDGSFVLDLGMPADVKMHVYDGASNGDWVLPIFKNPSKYLNSYVLACVEFTSPNDMAAVIAKASGKKVVAKQYTLEEFNSEAHKKALSDEMWLNQNGWVVNGLERDLQKSYDVVPKPRDLEYLVKNDKGFRTLLKLD
ncbi:NAD(P)-binding protein [Clavulina sp. PMI_390]|nr:NAD(P)-binding protein [Clavulina sp. PMI_390]